MDPVQQTFERLFGPEFGHGKAFNLLRLKEVLRQMGWRGEVSAPVIHVAGTNGKGSTIAFMRAIAEAAGLRVHAFTKPHLFALKERFIIAGQTADEARLCAVAARIAAVDYGISQFDAQVASALLLFSETPADLVLLETGMGGQQDSTNIIERPALCVITPIGIDHQDVLGPTLSDIATHKAGIIKRGVPVVVARQASAAMEVIETRAQEMDAQLLRQGAEWDAFKHAGRLIVQTETRALDLPTPALTGAHQIDNAGLACAAMLALYDFDDTAFAGAMRWTRLSGRLQPLTRGALSALVRSSGGELWVDGAHNVHGAEAIARELEAMNRIRSRFTVAIIGMLARKDAKAFVQALALAVDDVISVPVEDDDSQLHEITRAAPIAMTTGSYGSLDKALRRVAEKYDGPRVLVCGSLRLAAEALALENV